MRPPRTLARYVGVVLCAAALVGGPIALLEAGNAQADCTGAGDFGAGSGCPPPGDDASGSGGGESWPPTSVDWPPSQSSASSGGGGAKATPIVMPDGQSAPPKSADATDAASTSTPPTPIVPVGAPSSAATPTVIVSASP